MSEQIPLGTTGKIAAIGIPLFDGIIAFLQGSKEADANKKQANLLAGNIKELKKEIEAGKKSMTDAMSELDTMVSSLSGQFKTLITGQIDRTVGDIVAQKEADFANMDHQLELLKGTLTDEQEKQRKAMQDQIREYRASLGEQRAETTRQTGIRGLLGSEASAAGQAKSAETEGILTGKMLKQQGESEADFAKRLSQATSETAYQKGVLGSASQRNIANARASGADLLTQKLMGLQQYGFEGKQGIQSNLNNYNLSSLGTLMELQNKQQQFASAGKQDWLGDFLGGAAGGFGKSLSLIPGLKGA